MTAPPFITRWDLDKTYLRTEFDTLGDLVRTALERPDQKRAVPGAAALLRALGETGARVHILSGSPRQLGAKLEEKLRIDRVRWDELTLKPNLSNILRLRLKALRDQLGYKLPVLLGCRVRDQDLAEEGPPLREVLVGDDAEADAFVYSLYADIAAGEVSRQELERILRVGDVYADQRRICLDAVERLRLGETVERILIHLDRQSPPSTFHAYGPRVVPFYNYLQAAFVLAEDRRLSGEAVLEVATMFATRHRFDAEALGRSYKDLVRRGHAQGTILLLLEDALPKLAAGGARDTLVEMVALIRGYLVEPAPGNGIPPAAPDYAALADRHRHGKNRKQFRNVTGGSAH
ncbi:MAG TPA: hypothetical protein VHE30_23870 [Polyangiaceae bacterium]|nr:hypothetical protein [Polyangiaceae bacterium]